MTTFEDGPAKGEVLMLRRCPFMLRVVIDGAGKVDALNEAHDEPRAGERLSAYMMTGLPGWCSIRATGGGGGIFQTANYRLIEMQPSDAEMRDGERWRAFCTQPNYLALYEEQRHEAQRIQSRDPRAD